MAKHPDVLPWSYSSLTSFETCPRRHYLTKVTKQITEPMSEAILHGNRVHKALELHLNGTKTLPQEYADYLPMVERIKAQPGKRLVEYKFGVTEGFQPTEFFGKGVWYRGVIDVGIVGPKVAFMGDWKTGKPKSDGDQMKLFAAAAFAAFPYLERVKTAYIWLAHNKLDSAEYKREDVPEIWQEFTPRVIRLVKAQEKNDWPPKPSGLCKSWCPVPNSMCEFSGKQG